ncbi:Uncharacterised protein [Streptococcus pneumoniae]|nr:putative membrane protein [Streptococcus pneumoniae]SBO84232.1 putative membrane protein [Streptococcus pneumoniae]SNI82634.1 Uncharacterised protein [Streptococcus pneumoniae]SNJ06390.1 Uncharacterised protein [Streptococcus pneumoniae]SNJ59989.1 Uncharacterised protein [Streptococcus pneumoniae]
MNYIICAYSIILMFSAYFGYKKAWSICCINTYKLMFMYFDIV